MQVNIEVNDRSKLLSFPHDYILSADGYWYPWMYQNVTNAPTIFWYQKLDTGENSAPLQ